MDCEKRCDVCKFKYWVIYEEPEYFCMFGFKCCKLTESEKKKISRLKSQLEHVNGEVWAEKYNKTLTVEEEKELIEKRDALCKEINEYLDTLKKKGKVFYE